jgi:predicted AAA+ superfamily ATPase
MNNDDMPCKKIYPRLLKQPQGSFFLFGPRGTGKSTWLRRHLDEAHYIDLLDEARYHDYLRHPGGFADELRTLPGGAVVVVDEIQRIPQLLNEVHRFIEKSGLRFALCGSSARKLKQSGTNLLAGRAVRRSMHPFVPEEIGDDFDLEETLFRGTLPVILGAPDPDEALEAYAQMYLREEIQAEALVRSLPDFVRFLPVAALFHGQVINISSLARDAGVARTTVNGYLTILEDTLVAYRLPFFESRHRVRQRRHPKLYFCDPGIVRAIGRRRGSPGPEERGHLFEGWVAGLLRAYHDYRDLFDEWGYWAVSKTVEVDFVLRRGRDCVAVEVKSKERVSRHDMRGLHAVVGLDGLVRRILVTTGGRRQRTQDGIDVIPARDFADVLATGRLFDKD